MNEKPKHFKTFKVIGVIGIIVGIIGWIICFSNFGNFDNPLLFMAGGALGGFGMFVGVACLAIGFRPEMSKMGVKSAKYIQQENKDDLKDIANTTADITGEAVSKVVRSIKDGLDDEKMYCKHCGASIDADSRFCNKCGKEQ